MNVPPDRPFQVFMDTTSRCNLRCRMCLIGYQDEFLNDLPEEDARRLKSLPKEMSRELFVRIAADVFPRTNLLYLSCGTEPLMNKQFPWFLKHAAQYKIPRIAFTTNAMLMDETIIRTCIEVGLNELAVSLDGAKAETYESIRPGAKWDRVIGNIKRFTTIRREEQAAFPRLRMNYVIMRKNIEQVVDFVDLAYELGADLLDFRHVVVFDIAEEMRGESLAKERELTNTWLWRAKVRADERGIEVAYLPTFNPPSRSARIRNTWEGLKRRWSGEPRCRSPWELMVINYLGFMSPCAGWLRDKPLGHLGRQTLDEILASQAMTRLRNGLLGKEPLFDSCANCPTISSRMTEETNFTEIDTALIERNMILTCNEAFELGLDIAPARLDPHLTEAMQSKRVLETALGR